MQPNRSGGIAILVAMLMVAIGSALYLGFSATGNTSGTSAIAGSPASFDLSGGRLSVAVESGEAGSFDVTARVESDDGSDDASYVEPRVSMTMPAHSMGRAPVRLYRQPDGSWRGTGRFSMGGQWRLRIEFENDIFEIDHVAR